MRLRPRDTHFKVLPETAAPKPPGMRATAVAFWLLIALLATLLLFHLGRAWLFVHLDGTVSVSGYGLFSDRPLVLRALRVNEGDRITAGQVVAEVTPLENAVDPTIEVLQEKRRRLVEARALVEADAWDRLKRRADLLALLPESYLRGRALTETQVAKLFELAPLKPHPAWWRAAALADLARQLLEVEETLRRHTRFFHLTAPHDGEVIHVFKRAGEEIRRGELILRVRTGACEIHVPVPRSQATLLARRGRANVSLPDGTRWTAEVVHRLATSAPYRSRADLKRYTPAREESWRFVLRPEDRDFPCVRFDHAVVEIEFPRWPSFEWMSIGDD